MRCWFVSVLNETNWVVMLDNLNFLLFIISFNNLLITDISGLEHRLSEILLLLGERFIELVQCLNLVNHDSCGRADTISNLIICQVDNTSSCRLNTGSLSIRALSKSSTLLLASSISFHFTHLIQLFQAFILTFIVKQEIFFSIFLLLPY